MRISDWSSDVCSSDLGIDHIGFAISADLAGLALRPRLPDLTAIHAQLARKTAKLCKIVQWRIGASVVLGQQIHQIDVAVMVTADVVVVFEIAVVFAGIPIAWSRNPMEDRKSTRLNSSH